MTKTLRNYRHLSALLAVVMMVVILCALGMPLSLGLLIIGLWQLSQFAMSKRCAICFIAAMTDEQIKEFNEVVKKVSKDWDTYSDMFKHLKDIDLKNLPETLRKLGEENESQKKELQKLRKQSLLREGDTGVRYVRGVPFVTDSCALAFAGMYLACAYRQDKWNAARFGEAESTMEKAAGWVGVQRAALASTDIPTPTIYVPQIVELVYHYGQFRQFATVFPLGAGTVNLPQLKPGEDNFTFLGVGTAGMSQNVGEKKVSAQNVTFTANKCGGIIRIPTELEEDTFIPLGQFIARYIARRFAYLEDTTGFLGDGTGTYANIKGVGPYIAAVANTPQLNQLAAGKTKPTDSTLNDWRLMRTLVNAAVLQTGNAAYYAHPTMEALFVTFNTLNQPLIYRPAQGNQPATLDGFPIRWVGAMQPYSTKAAASAYLGFFGDLSYWYLGERGAPRVETSREVYFATDEIGMRALERIDVEAMAPDAMAALQTAAA